MSTSMFFKLCSRAPRTAMTFELGGGAKVVMRQPEQRKNSLFHVLSGESTARAWLVVGHPTLTRGRATRYGASCEFVQLLRLGQVLASKSLQSSALMNGLVRGGSART